MIKKIGDLIGRRVVVTGLGLATCFGNNLDHIWGQLMSGKSGVRTIESFDTSELGCKIAAPIIYGQEKHEIDLDKFIDSKEQKRSSSFIHHAYVASACAIEDSGLLDYLCNISDESQRGKLKERIGLMIGSGIGGLTLIEKTTLDAQHFSLNNNASNENKVNPIRNPFFIPASLINLASGNISVKYGFKGPNTSVVTACATGAHAIGDAARLILFGDADVMVAGGTEASICKIGIAGFDAMKALSTQYNDCPQKASRPWNKTRDGFVMGEGSGILILEEYEHAKKRGAKIYAEITGYGLSGDAYHMSAPHPDGNGGKRAMKAALDSARLSIKDLNYLNAHGTSTPMGDSVELRAIKALFDEYANEHNDDALELLKKLPLSSTKSSIGHLLGAAGAVEAIFSIMTLDRGEIPPTINLTEDEMEDAAKEFNIICLHNNKNRYDCMKHVATNSFGFGGTNACLIFSKI